MQRAQRLDASIQWNTLVLHLVDDAGIRRAHQAYFGVDTVTDVISQQYPPLPPEHGYQGEIIVNVQQALRAHALNGWSRNRELALYIAHGIDHLHGSTDATEQTRLRMRRRELRWLRQIQNKGFPLESLDIKVRQPRKI